MRLKIIFSFCCLLFGIGVNAKPVLKIIESNDSYVIIDITFEKLSEKNYESGILNIAGCTPIQKLGAPNLPKYSFSLQIPDTKNSTLEILQQSSETIDNITILPSKGKLSRKINPADIPYTYGDEYTSNQFFPATDYIISNPYILRDYRGQTFHINPVKYNAVTKQLIAYQTMRIKISFNGTNNINSIVRSHLPQKISESYYQIYQNKFANFNPTLESKKTRYTPLIENDKLIIFCPQKYAAAIEPFFVWKKQKGIYTTLVITDTLTGGATIPTIYNYIKDKFTNENITHVLMVGDVNDIPVYTSPTIFGNGSDNPYGYILGGDHYAEVVVSRFKGMNENQIKTQVYKSILYEKKPNLLSKWYGNCMAIGSAQGPGDDNEYDWQHERNIADSLINFGPYKNKIEFYDGSQGGKDSNGNPMTAVVIDSINAGVGLINYTGHGDIYGLITSTFFNPSVPTLKNNIGNWPFMLTVGCSTGNFVTPDPCFAEMLQYTLDSTQRPIGTVINTMSTVDQWWNEPMQAQDEFNDILRDAYIFANKHCFATMMNNSFFSMMDKYNIPNTSDSTGGDQMTDTWQIFGDPTLIVRTDYLGDIICGTGATTLKLPIGSTTYSTTCNVDSADVCLYYKNEILATAKSYGGVVNFNFPNIILDTLDSVIITATKYNYAPFFNSSKDSIYNSLILNLGINNLELNNVITIYPIPANQYFTIESTLLFSNVQLYDITGKLVENINVEKLKHFQVPITDLASGNYFVKIKTEKGVVVKRVIKN